MKNIYIGLLVCVFLGVSAEVKSAWGSDFFDIGMVSEKDNSSILPVAIYDYDQTPWVYVPHISVGEATNLSNLVVTYQWRPEIGAIASDSEEYAYFENMQLFKSPSLWNGDEWDDSILPIRQAGSWDVYVEISGYNMNDPEQSYEFGSESTQFYVNATPEPVSSVLFLIGGGALAFFRIKGTGYIKPK